MDTNEGGNANFSMPVAPAYTAGGQGGFGFGGDWVGFCCFLYSLATMAGEADLAVDLMASILG